MEMMCIGFLGGVLFAIIAILVFLVLDKDESNTDRDSDTDGNDADGKSDGVVRNPTSEEIENVLYVLRFSASNREKEVIDYLIDKEGVQHEDD